MPTVELLILTYNRLGETARCLSTVLPLLNANLKCHILDNGSTDKTPLWLLKQAQKYSHLKVDLSVWNLGVAGGREWLLRTTKADIIGFLDSDVTILESNWLANVYKTLEDKTIGVTGQKGHKILDNGTTQPFPEDYTGPVNVISGYSQFFRRKDMLKNRIEVDMQFNWGGAEDDDFCLQWQAKGFMNHKINLPIVHEWGGTWTTGNYSENQEKLRLKWLVPKSLPTHPTAHHPRKK